MNSKQITQHLEQMQGKTFQYASSIHYVKDFHVDVENDKFKITTNLNSFDRSFESAKEFFSYWSEVNQLPANSTNGISPEGGNQLQVYIDKETNLADKMIDILTDNIEKVRADPKYIPQATAINNNVNSIINVAKMKMDFIKTTRARK